MKLKPNSLLKSTIELTQAPAFGDGFRDDTPFPILFELGNKNFHHSCPSVSSVDVTDMVSRLYRKLIRSEFGIKPNGATDYKSAIFKTRRGNFATCTSGSISIYGENHRAVERLARRLQYMSFHQKKDSPVAGYTLIKKSTFNVDKEFVPLLGDKPLLDSDLELLYGKDFLPWHNDFQRKIHEKTSGISILEGPPGCGKTSFIRSFMKANTKAYRFYYITPQDIYLMSDPEFIVLWSAEIKQYSDYKLVLIIEDAEQALYARGNDNRTLVSTLLNYSDGLLSDYLKMQIICTINCKATDIDAALMRPGRLISHRIFKRLSDKEALRLAESRGLSLTLGQSDYSLAEIFNGPADTQKRGDVITGFAA